MPNKEREKKYHRNTPINHKLIDLGDGTFAELIVTQPLDATDFIADIEIRDVGYNIANKDADGTPNYYGFEDASGAWYIMRETLSVGNDAYEYVKGDSDYSTNWTGRAGLSYTSYSSAF